MRIAVTVGEVSARTGLLLGKGMVRMCWVDAAGDIETEVSLPMAAFNIYGAAIPAGTIVLVEDVDGQVLIVVSDTIGDHL